MFLVCAEVKNEHEKTCFFLSKMVHERFEELHDLKDLRIVSTRLRKEKAWVDFLMKRLEEVRSELEQVRSMKVVECQIDGQEFVTVSRM